MEVMDNQTEDGRQDNDPRRRSKSTVIEGVGKSVR